MASLMGGASGGMGMSAAGDASNSAAAGSSMGSMMSGLGGGSTDLTFGQGKVWQDKIDREMKLLTTLLGHTPPGAQVTSGQNPGAVQVQRFNPVLVSQLLNSFNAR